MVKLLFSQDHLDRCRGQRCHYSKSISRDANWEAIEIVQGRDDGSLDQSCSSRDDINHLNSEYTLKVELKKFAKRLNESVRQRAHEFLFSPFSVIKKLRIKNFSDLCQATQLIRSNCHIAWHIVGNMTIEMSFTSFVVEISRLQIQCYFQNPVPLFP